MLFRSQRRMKYYIILFLKGAVPEISVHPSGGRFYGFEYRALFQCEALKFLENPGALPNDPQVALSARITIYLVIFIIARHE